MSNQWLVGSCLLLLTIQSAQSAVVANEMVAEKVKDTLHKMFNSSNVTDPFQLLSSPMADPLSLQFAVLQVTDSLGREMDSRTWQAMLRALGGDREILKRFAHLRPRFSALERQLSLGKTEDFFTELGHIKSPWSSLWPELQNMISPIASLHEWFDRYQRNAAVVNERTLQDYADTVHAKDEVATGKMLQNIHNMVCPKLEGEQDSDPKVRRACTGGVFDALSHALSQANDELICSMTKSPHQLVYDLYTMLALTDAKGYAMMQFSWMLLRLYGKGNFTLESEIARSDFEHRLIEKAEAARRVVSRLPTWMWKCDLPSSEQKENVTFLQFTEVLQGYIVNEVDLNQYNTCKESCSSYSNSQESNCYAAQFCTKARRCPSGRIYNCGYIEADSEVCLTNATGRRYDWVEYKSGRLFGSKTECNKPGQSKTRADSWWRWLFWHCSYCTCLCDQPGPSSDRYISLQPAQADIANGYVVTGLRFIKLNRVVHIQIQEGVALPRGSVNVSSIRWKPVNTVQVNAGRDPYADGPGYATLRYEERGLDLDDLVAQDGQVVTGVRFRKLGGHLNLEVQVAPIDFVTATIDTGRATWVSNDNTPAAEVRPRTKLLLTSPDIPTRTVNPSIPDSQPDQYIEFQASSLDRDVSQTTVPFLDAQAVYPQPAIWLTGVGIYHKGQPGYGGYIAFRISTLNISNYLVLPKSSRDEDNEEF